MRLGFNWTGIGPLSGPGRANTIVPTIPPAPGTGLQFNLATNSQYIPVISF